jgi:soluble lytic murein transglycosylase
MLFIAIPCVAEPAHVELAQAAAGAASARDKPASPLAREKAYTAKLDTIVAPLLSYSLPAEDGTKLAAAFKALSSGDTAKAKEVQATLSDPLARTLVEWERLRRGKGEAADYLKFLAEHPDWPSRESLQKKMEESLFSEGGDTELIATYFKGREARSPAGMAVLASVHLAHGEKDKAKALAAKIWPRASRRDSSPASGPCSRTRTISGASTGCSLRTCATRSTVSNAPRR